MITNQFTQENPAHVAVYGATGSIGMQTLDVARQHQDKVVIEAITVNSSINEAIEIAREFNVRYVVIANEKLKDDSRLSDFPAKSKITFGAQALVDLVHEKEINVVLNAIMGAAGMRVSYETLSEGKRLALANKESLVVAGDLIMPLTSQGELIPVDSEHSAIFQCLQAGKKEEVRRLWLTASGGPFFGRTFSELSGVTAQDALAHPTWKMGPKITVDSATLMNKGLEVLEAVHLFNVHIDQVEIAVQRQSAIHSMVEYIDGSVIAHLGATDMRIPIQYAISYPDRWETTSSFLDYQNHKPITFDAPDLDSFPSLNLALEAGRVGGTLPCVMNAANEIAVDAFLKGSCPFLDIPSIVEKVMDAHASEQVTSLEQLGSVDTWARTKATELI